MTGAPEARAAETAALEATVAHRIRVVAVTVAGLALLAALVALFVRPGFALLGVAIALGSTQLAGY